MAMATGAVLFLASLNTLSSSDTSVSVAAVSSTTEVVKTKTNSRSELNARRSLSGSRIDTIPSKIGPIDASDLWNNDHNLVHVVSTHFMQHQGNLTDVGLARLDLFETFTVPSLLKQSNQQYLWLIWTDAKIDEAVCQKLLDSVSRLPNVVVLAMEREADSNLRNLYGHSWESIKSSVLSGDSNLLAEYYKASHFHVLLETSLDADDAISEAFIESVQGEAAYTIGHNEEQLDMMEVYCPEIHAEWSYFPGDNSMVQDQSEGRNLVHIHDENDLVESGLTVAYHVEASARRLALCSEDEQTQCKVRKFADRGHACDGNERKKQRLMDGDSGQDCRAEAAGLGEDCPFHDEN